MQQTRMGKAESQMSEILNAIELIKGARNLIANPRRWTQGSLARDRYGEEIGPCLMEAKRWCMIGALLKIDLNRTTDSYRWAVDFLNNEMPPCMGIHAFNDQNSHAKVIELMDKVIDKWEKRLK